MNIKKTEVDHLNELLQKAVTDYKYNGRKFLYDKVKDLQAAIEKAPFPIVSLAMEIDKNIKALLPSNDLAFKLKIEKLLSRHEEILTLKKQVVHLGDFETAARLRDEEKQIPIDLISEIMRVHSFYQGFNLFKGKVLVILNGDADKEQVLSIVMNRIDKNLMP